MRRPAGSGGAGYFGFVGVDSRADAIAAMIAGEVRQDRSEPGPEVGAGREPMRGTEGVQVRILNQVLGLGPIGGEPPRQRLQRAQMLERFGVERWFAVPARSCHSTIVNTGPHLFIQRPLNKGWSARVTV